KNEMHQEFTNQYETIKNKYQEELNVMTMVMKDEIAKYQEQIKDANKKYAETMNTKYKEYKVLIMKHDEATQIIRKQARKIRIFEEALNLWRAKWLNNLRECEERNAKLM